MTRRVASWPVYMPALERAHCIVLAFGINDTSYRSSAAAVRNYAEILNAMPQGCHVIVSAILPTSDSSNSIANSVDDRSGWIREFNSELESLADERDNVTYLDSTPLLDRDGDNHLDSVFDDGDGLHLNSKGNLVWSASIGQAIRTSAKTN